jgi:hypothetical protein
VTQEQEEEEEEEGSGGAIQAQVNALRARIAGTQQELAGWGEQLTEARERDERCAIEGAARSWEGGRRRPAGMAVAGAWGLGLGSWRRRARWACGARFGGRRGGAW